MNALRNKVSLIGRLGRDPEMITFDSGKSLTRFSMATHQKYKSKMASGTRTSNGTT